MHAIELPSRSESKSVSTQRSWRIHFDESWNAGTICAMPFANTGVACTSCAPSVAAVRARRQVSGAATKRVESFRSGVGLESRFRMYPRYAASIAECGWSRKATSPGYRSGNKYGAGVRREAEPHRTFRRVRDEQPFLHQPAENLSRLGSRHSGDPARLAASDLAAPGRFAEQRGGLGVKRPARRHERSAQSDIMRDPLAERLKLCRAPHECDLVPAGLQIEARKTEPARGQHLPPIELVPLAKIGGGKELPVSGACPRETLAMPTTFRQGCRRCRPAVRARR